MFDSPFRNPRLQVSGHRFSEVPSVNIPRSSFNRSHGYKTTFNAGDIVPIFVDEALPGDTFSLRMTTFARLATPIAPFMDNLYADVFFFAVPVRLVWNNFQKFMGEQESPGDSISYLVPTATETAAVGGLSDYMGIPTGVSLSRSNLWHRAYNLVWNQWFRDENLQTPVTVDKGDGPDTAANYVIKKRGKRHDYFTSALPWPQKGTAVSLPLGTTAPVYGNIVTSNQNSAMRLQAWDSGAGVRRTDAWLRQDSAAAKAYVVTATGLQVGGSGAVNIAAKEDGFTSFVYADLTNATAATINELRYAMQVQALLERDARGGTRYTEIILSHFGVVSDDARLQRPEFLGGGSSMVNTSPIPQTSSTDATTPQGNLAAMGTFSHSGIGFTKSFTEHCLLLGLISVRADLSYQQGLNRMFSRSTRYDFYWPGLAHLGEQSILNKEIYAQGTSADTDVFGYQERYAEYRYKPSVITGKFRSTDATPLDMWHLAEEFSSLPTLGSTFIQVNPPMSRIKAVTTEPDFLFDAAIDLKCARPMPVYSVPSLGAL